MPPRPSSRHVSTSVRTRSHVGSRGLSTLELVIACALLALLVAISLPATSTYTHRPRRMDGIAALLTLQQAQERYRGSHATYAASLGALGQSTVSTARHYQLSTSVVASTADSSYRLTAAAQGAQLADSQCLYLALVVDQGITRQSSGATADVANTTTANRACWRD